jgi:hypothetical protein
MSSDAGNGGGLLYRLTNLEQAFGRLDEWRSQVDQQRAIQGEQMRNQSIVIGELSTEVKGLRRTLMTLAISIASSAVIFAVSVLVATGRVGG